VAFFLEMRITAPIISNTMPVPFRNDVLMKNGERVEVIANDPGIIGSSNSAFNTSNLFLCPSCIVLFARYISGFAGSVVCRAWAMVVYT